ncbi:MAG: hypothetical protein ABT940_00300 [Alphaproteobacteria bacterium]
MIRLLNINLAFTGVVMMAAIMALLMLSRGLEMKVDDVQKRAAPGRAVVAAPVSSHVQMTESRGSGG